MSISPELAAGAVLVSAAVACGPLAIRAAFWMRPGRQVFFASWGFGQVLVGLIAASVAGLLAAGFLGAPWSSLVTLFGLAGGCLVALASARRAQREPWVALGLSRRSLAPRALAVGPLLALLAVPAGIGAALLVGEPTALGPGAAWLPDSASGLDPRGLVIFLLIAPLVTELWFRGFLQPLLVQNFSERGGLLLSAVLFASIHGPAAFLPMLALGLALALAKLRTQSTFSAVLGAVLWNATALALASFDAGSIQLPLAL